MYYILKSIKYICIMNNKLTLYIIMNKIVLLFSINALPVCIDKHTQFACT